MQIASYHLMSMPSAQCHIELFRTDAGILKEIRLVSYTTTILTAEYEGSDVKLTVNYPVDCSKTTARHVNRFTTELNGTSLYYVLKKVPVGGTCIVDGAGICLSDMAWKYASYGKRYW